MKFEAEAVPLFIIGVIFVHIIELLGGMHLLRNKPKNAQHKLIGHVVSSLLSFILLFLIFASEEFRLFGFIQIQDSINLALYGITWAISIYFILQLIELLTKPSE